MGLPRGFNRHTQPYTCTRANCSVAHAWVKSVDREALSTKWFCPSPSQKKKERKRDKPGIDQITTEFQYGSNLANVPEGNLQQFVWTQIFYCKEIGWTWHCAKFLTCKIPVGDFYSCSTTVHAQSLWTIARPGVRYLADCDDQQQLYTSSDSK